MVHDVSWVVWMTGSAGPVSNLVSTVCSGPEKSVKLAGVVAAGSSIRQPVVASSPVSRAMRRVV